MNAKEIHNRFVVGSVLLATMFLTPGAVMAHCDGMDGPVVKAAQAALSDENVNRVLIWVQPNDEDAIKTAFQKTLTVRKLGPEARELADTYFFETLVRIHRAGEGAPYTGLKAAGRDLGPIIPAADKAIEQARVEPLLKLLHSSAHANIRKRFKEVLARNQFKTDDVQAGRAYVAAYVAFMHAAEGVHESGHGHAAGHRHEGQSPGHPEPGGHQHPDQAGGQHAAPACPSHGNHRQADHFDVPRAELLEE